MEVVIPFAEWLAPLTTQSARVQFPAGTSGSAISMDVCIFGLDQFMCLLLLFRHT